MPLCPCMAPVPASVTHVTAAARRAPVGSGGMADVPLDTQERRELCDLLDELGPSVPTLLEGWTAHDIAAHLVLRERDVLAGPCLVLPGPFQRFAEQRRSRLAENNDFAWLVARIRTGPPIGFFRIGWVRSFPTLNEFFVHHEDVRRANGLGARRLTPAMNAALWRNVRRGSRYLSRRFQGFGLEIEWSGTDQTGLCLVWVDTQRAKSHWPKSGARTSSMSTLIPPRSGLGLDGLLTTA